MHGCVCSNLSFWFNYFIEYRNRYFHQASPIILKLSVVGDTSVLLKDDFWCLIFFAGHPSCNILYDMEGDSFYEIVPHITTNSISTVMCVMSYQHDHVILAWCLCLVLLIDFFLWFSGCTVVIWMLYTVLHCIRKMRLAFRFLNAKLV